MKCTGVNCLQLTDTKPGTDKQMTADHKFLLHDWAFLLADDSCVIRNLPQKKRGILENGQRMASKMAWLPPQLIV